ncbi:MAG: LysR family transcriptional regulator [Paracoccaceae bacterium]
MSAMPLNLRHLRAFYEVGVVGRVSPVADLIYMSQPAVSQALAKFEKHCGAKLFFRQPNGLILTDAGLLMHTRVARALQFLDNGTRQITTRHSDGLRLSRQITTTQLKALVAIADSGSFTKGARVIGTSQPAVSRAIRDLEKLCNCPLVEKTGRGIVLTTAAETLAQSARLAFNELRQGEDEIRALHSVDTSVLTIGSLPLARSAVLPKAILAFAAEKLDVAIHVIDGPYDVIFTGLLHGEIDVLIGALRSPPPNDGAVEVPLFNEELSVIVRAGHPLADRKGITPAELLAYPWIVPRNGTPTRDYYDRFAAKSWGGKNPHLIEASSLILIRGLLVESDSLTIISGQQVFFELETGTLVRLDIKLEGSQRPIGLTYRRTWHPTKTQARFLDDLSRTIRGLGLTEDRDVQINLYPE